MTKQEAIKKIEKLTGLKLHKYSNETSFYFTKIENEIDYSPCLRLWLDFENEICFNYTFIKTKRNKKHIQMGIKLEWAKKIIKYAPILFKEGE